jgi:hypothetical protein
MPTLLRYQKYVMNLVKIAAYSKLVLKVDNVVRKPSCVNFYSHAYLITHI